jgi:hypothetical protein
MAMEFEGAMSAGDALLSGPSASSRMDDLNSVFLSPPSSPSEETIQ